MMVPPSCGVMLEIRIKTILKLNHLSKIQPYNRIEFQPQSTTNTLLEAEISLYLPSVNSFIYPL